MKNRHSFLMRGITAADFRKIAREQLGVKTLDPMQGDYIFKYHLKDSYVMGYFTDSDKGLQVSFSFRGNDKRLSLTEDAYRDLLKRIRGLIEFDSYEVILPADA